MQSDRNPSFTPIPPLGTRPQSARPQSARNGLLNPLNPPSKHSTVDKLRKLTEEMSGLDVEPSSSSKEPSYTSKHVASLRTLTAATHTETDVPSPDKPSRHKTRLN